ncbi:MAG: hypothetical protein AB1473_01975 [Thermodesulfobacteriota bacterium]
MSERTERYLVPPNRDLVQSVREALALAKRLYREISCEGPICLVVPSRQNLRHTALEAGLGKRAMKALLADKVAMLEGIECQLQTTATISYEDLGHVAVAFYARQDMLDELDDLWEARVIIAVPDKMDKIAQWIRTWNPTSPGQEPVDPDPLIKNPVLEEALRNITERINLTTGLGHPLDESYTMGLLKLLGQNGLLEDPADIRAWAIRNRWSPDDASHLARIARECRLGKPLRGGQEWGFNKNTIIRLREKALQRGTADQ